VKEAGNLSHLWYQKRKDKKVGGEEKVRLKNFNCGINIHIL